MIKSGTKQHTFYNLSHRFVVVWSGHLGEGFFFACLFCCLSVQMNLSAYILSMSVNLGNSSLTPERQMHLNVWLEGHVAPCDYSEWCLVRHVDNLWLYAEVFYWCLSSHQIYFGTELSITNVLYFCFFVHLTVCGCCWKVVSCTAPWRGDASPGELENRIKSSLAWEICGR